MKYHCCNVLFICSFERKKNKDSSYAQQLILDANFFAQLVNSNIHYIVCGQFLILGPICFCGQGSVEPEFWWLCNQDDHHTCFPSPFTRDKDAQYTSRSELTCSAENCKLAKCHFQMPLRQVTVLLANSVFLTWNVKSRVALLYCYILEFKIDQYQLRFAKHNVIFVCNEKYWIIFDEWSLCK